jgi:hypothetical protein
MQAKTSIKLIHAVDSFGTSDRHKRAQSSWQPLYDSGMMIPFRMERYPRNAKDLLKDPRELPFMKDLLAGAINHADLNDVVIWTNDDITLAPSLPEWAAGYVTRHRATSMRRLETTPSDTHIGRDLMAFQVSWLREFWDEIPDYILGASDFDLGMSALIRHKNGVKSHLGNMATDLPPSDAPARLIAHEAHKGAWDYGNISMIPSTKWNRRQFMGWAFKYQPTMRFNTDGLLQ